MSQVKVSSSGFEVVTDMKPLSETIRSAKSCLQEFTRQFDAKAALKALSDCEKFATTVVPVMNDKGIPIHLKMALLLLVIPIVIHCQKPDAVVYFNVMYNELFRMSPGPLQDLFSGLCLACEVLHKWHGSPSMRNHMISMARDKVNRLILSYIACLTTAVHCEAFRIKGKGQKDRKAFVSLLIELEVTMKFNGATDEERCQHLKEVMMHAQQALSQRPESDPDAVANDTEFFFTVPMPPHAADLISAHLATDGGKIKELFSVLKREPIATDMYDPEWRDLVARTTLVKLPRESLAETEQLWDIFKVLISI